MDVHELVIEMKLLERRLTLYETWRRRKQAYSGQVQALDLSSAVIRLARQSLLPT